MNNRDVFSGRGSQLRGLWPVALGRRALRQIGVGSPGGGINGTAFERQLDGGQQRLQEAGTEAVAMAFLLKDEQVGRAAQLLPMRPANNPGPAIGCKSIMTAPMSRPGFSKVC